MDADIDRAIHIWHREAIEAILSIDVAKQFFVKINYHIRVTYRVHLEINAIPGLESFLRFFIEKVWHFMHQSVFRINRKGMINGAIAARKGD